MNKKWILIYYEYEPGKSEVLEYINSLKINEQTKVFSWLTKLEELGPILPRPYSDLLEDGIHELRIKIKGKQIRILYFFCYKSFIVVTSSFEKKSEKVPEKEIIKAKKLREDFLKKYSTEQLLLEEIYDKT